MIHKEVLVCAWIYRRQGFLAFGVVGPHNIEMFQVKCLGILEYTDKAIHQASLKVL